MGRVGGAVFSKTALRLRGIDVGGTRLPLPPPTDQQVRDVAADLLAAGVALAPDPYSRVQPGAASSVSGVGAEVAYR
jgi:4-hydroxy-tetrahydrodipicolinate synthase